MMPIKSNLRKPLRFYYIEDESQDTARLSGIVPLVAVRKDDY